jgi:hypothetical protein
MKNINKVISLTFFSLFAILYFVAPANAAGAPECFISRPQTCNTYDYVEESVNTSGQICKTRYYSAGSSQSSEGLGCTGPVKEEPKPQDPVSGNNSSVVSNPVSDIKNDIPTNIVSNPSVVVSPTITGNRNSVSAVVNNTNTTNNTVVNSTTNNVSSVVNTVSNVEDNRSEYRTISVNGGVLVIGENGFGKFFPTTQENSPKSPVSNNDSEISYLEKSELPVSIQRSLNRIPEEVSQKKNLRLPIALKDAESITEDICVIENRRVSFVSKGTCVLEIPVGEGIYEHEIKVIK